MVGPAEATKPALEKKPSSNNVMPQKVQQVSGKVVTSFGPITPPTKQAEDSEALCSRCKGSKSAGLFSSNCARCSGSGKEGEIGSCSDCSGEKRPCAKCVLKSGTGKCTRCHSRFVTFGCARCGGK